nr:MAG TPA: hypothetical protein [Caudoviricetes sp.]
MSSRNFLFIYFLSSLRFLRVRSHVLTVLRLIN